MAFNYNKLRGKIREVFGRQEDFAEAIGMSKGTLSQKLNNVVEFRQEEMMKAVKLLGLTNGDINEYFFTEKVRKDEN